MAITLSKLFEPTLLTSSAATIYTVTGATNVIVENLVLRLTNTTGTGETCTINTGTASTTNQIFNAEVPANDFVLVSVPVLKLSNIVQAKQTNSGTIVNIQHESGLPKS